ncbi:hypothetical protein K4K57_010613 [Colletotrichum sp. SAR 10_99]|nr:hypothetical protein K4K57_010613 [Colletotrichum sp. SAR 10_99]
MATWISPSEVYAVGKEVTLYPYEPVRPHGMPQYDRNCLPSDLRPGELRDFAKPDKKLEAKIRITEAIRIDQNRYSQIFACEVVAVPRKERPTWYQQSLSQTDKSMKQKPLTRKLVCKTIDAQFFPSSFGGPYSNSEEADGLLSRIHAAYAYYRGNKKTGYPHTMPQFYGGWAMKVAGGMDEEGRTVSRHVGLVLIEHIDGFSVEDLCIRDDDDQDWGTLAPRPGPVRFRTNGNEYKNITFDLKTRQLVMQQAIHGVVQGFQLGVEHHDFGPWNIFVTMRDGYQGLRELRVVILDHNDTQVWYETKYAKKSGRAYCLQKLPHPVHPAERCSAVALEKWRGFWPPTSDQCSGADADKQFAAWLRHKDVFGPKVEAKAPPYRGIPDENVEPKRSIKGLKKSVVKKPYAQKTYSTFDTLDLIGEREDAIDKPIIPTIMGELGVQDQPEEYVKGIEMAVRRAFLGGYQVKSVVNGSPYPGPDHEWWKAWRHDKPAPYDSQHIIEIFIVVVSPICYNFVTPNRNKFVLAVLTI